MAAIVPGRFQVEAESRHPRLGTDYSAVTHTFTDAYLNPRSYGITIDAFPGKTLRIPKGDIQVRPGGDTKNIRDIWDLDCPKDTTGWTFSIKGRPARRLPIGPRPPEFTATTTTRLVTTTGLFHEDRDDNAWNARFNVPGPGTYEVTVQTLRRAAAAQVRTATLVVKDLLVVSIGDSAASGEGNPDIPGSPEGFDPDIPWWAMFVPAVALFILSKEAYDWLKNQLKKNMTTLARKGEWTLDMDPRPVWLEPLAHRSLRSGHAHAAVLLENLKKGTVVTFLPFGRTGSEIPDGLIGPRTSNGKPIDQWIGNIGEIEEVSRTLGQREIDALLIYVGVNDMEVANNLKSLVVGDNKLAGGIGDPTEARRAVEARGRANLAALPAKFQDLADALAVLNVRQVYLTEYPTGLFDNRAGDAAAGCGIFTSNFGLNLSLRDAETIKTMAEELNGVLKQVAEDRGWFYVSGIAAAFKGRGYCTGDERYFVEAEESLGLQGDTEGTIHPNPDGHRRIGESVAKLVQKNTVDVPRSNVHGVHGSEGPMLADRPAAGAPGTAGIPGPATTPRPRRRVRSRQPSG
jgi:hypothetical protein